MAGSSLKHHCINYIEFAVSDLTKAKTFYHSAFGWEFNDYGPAYAGIKGESGEVGGLRTDPTVTTGGPLVILYSEDLEEKSQNRHLLFPADGASSLKIQAAMSWQFGRKSRACCSDIIKNG